MVTVMGWVLSGRCSSGADREGRSVIPVHARRDRLRLGSDARCGGDPGILGLCHTPAVVGDQGGGAVLAGDGGRVAHRSTPPAHVAVGFGGERDVGAAVGMGGPVDPGDRVLLASGVGRAAPDDGGGRVVDTGRHQNPFQPSALRRST